MGQYTGGTEELVSNGFINDITDSNEGKYMISYSTSSQVYAQLYDNNDDKIGNELFINDGYNNKITSLTDGNFVVVWGVDTRIYCKIYNNNGIVLKDDFQINDEDGSRYNNVIGLDNDKFIIVWEGGHYIYGKMYNNNGSVFKNDFIINTIRYKNKHVYIDDFSRTLSIEKLVNNKFVVLSQSYLGGLSRIYCNIYTDEGTPIKNIIIQYSICGMVPDITGLSDGKFVVTWSSCFVPNSDLTKRYFDGVYAQIYNNDGSIFFLPFRVDTEDNTMHTSPKIVGLNDDKFIISWYKYKGGKKYIVARIFYNNGLPDGDEFIVSQDNYDNLISIVANIGNGKFVVSWLKLSSTYTIYKKTYSSPTLSPTPNPTLNPTPSPTDAPTLSPTLSCFPNEPWNANLVGDGKCHSVTNTAECNWDGGDCCEETCNHQDCGIHWDYYCKDPSINPYINCEENYQIIGDGLCHSDANNEDCGYDGGDCCVSTCQGVACGAWGYSCIDPSA